ncbi:hypothetical protein LCGC14_1438630 [marine sediment metagenome]|uniref:Uncharacterized protein n=1 Tax=marine sediment metagenome TaxID=412755 RepID=A0A0F9JLX4_9ZZZZ
MTNEDYAKILNELVDSIRSKLQDPDQSELKHPLQIVLIWFRSTKNDIQFLLFNHEKKFSDKTFVVSGPYNFSRKNVLNNLGADIQKGKMFQSFINNENVIKADLKRLIRINIPYLKKDLKNKVIKDGVLNKSYYLIYLGNLFDSPQKVFFEFFQQKELEKKKIDALGNSLINGLGVVQTKTNLEDLPTEVQDFIKQPDLDMKASKIPFLAGYIHPPIWIGNPPYFTDQERFYNVPLNTYIKTVKYVEIFGRRIIIMNDGFLAISINGNLDGQFEHSEMEETYKLIDLFLSLLLISKVDGYFEVYSTRETEFYYTDYNMQKDTFIENHGFSSYSRKMFELRQKTPSRSQFQSIRTCIDPLHIELVLIRFKTFSKLDIIQRSLKLLIDSYTHLIRLEFVQSFILSWVLIEQYLNYEWDLYLDQRKISKNEKKKYTANKKINRLFQLGILREADNRELSRLRHTRNDFMHEIRLVRGNGANKSFKLALRFVKKRIDDYYESLSQEFLGHKLINEEDLR